MSRVLIVANETVGADELLAEIRGIEAAGASEYYVVVPARPLHEVHGALWTQEGAIAAAQSRLDAVLAILTAEGLRATGTIGDTRPDTAVRDALMDFPAEEIVISTHPLERSTWLRRNVVDQVRAKFRLPVRHVISHVPSTAPPAAADDGDAPLEVPGEDPGALVDPEEALPAAGPAYTLTTWVVKPGREEEFVRAWRELGAWSRAQAADARGTLVRDREAPNRFVSFAPWPSAAAAEARRGEPGFGERIEALRALLDDFELTTLDVVAEVP
jgi:quinol monooxygenase YgiN